MKSKGARLKRHCKKRNDQSSLITIKKIEYKPKMNAALEKELLVIKNSFFKMYSDLKSRYSKINQAALNLLSKSELYDKFEFLQLR